MTKKLIYNAIMTPDGTVLESRSRHDYKTYQDANGKTYMIDGGLDYSRMSGHKDQIDLQLYNDEPHEVQRDVITWGSYGKNGDEPLHYIKVKDMETEHIWAVLQECRPYEVVTDCMTKELELRGE